MLLISQPYTPGLSPIPAMKIETHGLRDMMAKEDFKSLLLGCNEATMARVTEEMKTHNWVHFACHAIQDKEPIFLLLKRTPQDGGFWQPLTGTVEDGEKLSDCLKRELNEETGIKDIITLLENI